MAVLAESETAVLALMIADIGVPDYETLRTPEQGLVMVRGRVGGDGAPFNLGEATVSRAAVRLATGEVGFGYVLGRDSQKAALIALCDAMIQSSDYRSKIENGIVAPLREQLTQRRLHVAAQAAATRVDFYTMVRGEG